MKLCKRLLFTALCAAAPVFAAQEFPSRPITLVVPYGAGGLTDVVIRTVARLAEKELGQPVIILNKGGANGTLGALAMSTAKPDGYQLAVVPGGVFRIPYLQKVAFDPVKDLTYISGLADYSYLIMVRGDAPWKSVKDLMVAAKKEPGKYTYGSPGMYSTPQMTMDDVANASGAQIVHVPYKGGVDIVMALLAKQVDVVVGGGSGTLTQYVKEGKIRILGTMNRQRGSDYPDTPTLKENGYEVGAFSPMGVVGPKDMDEAVVKKLDKAFHAAVQDPEFHKLMESVGMSITYMQSDEYKKYAKNTFAAEGERMRRVLALEGKKPANE